MCKLQACVSQVRKVINLLGYPTAGTEIYVRLRRKPLQLTSTMAGPTMAGRPCQPTNPPPKRYKPPILTKARPQGDLQQRDIQTKISSPYCGAGTDSYATSYRQISTNIGKPTMTLITGTTYPTLQQNTHQVIKDQQELKDYTATLTHVKSNARPCSSPLPTDHNPNDRPHEPI